MKEIETTFQVENETAAKTTNDCAEISMRFSVKGGKKIFGAAVLPARHAEGETFPTVILSHGYGGRYSDELDRAYRFAKLGYACFCFDFGGINPNSQTEGAMTDTTLDTEKEELRAVVDFVSARSFCNKRELYLYGESMGGFVTALVASEEPERFRAVVLIYPAFSIPTDYANGGGLANWQKFKENALSYRGKEDEIFAKCAMPVLIQHGTADELVDISFSRKAVKVFPNAKLIELSGAGHGVNMPWQEVVENSDAFIAAKKKRFMKTLLEITVRLLETIRIDRAAVITFDGEAHSAFFDGKIYGKGADTQIRNADGSVRLSARYVLRGRDFTGAECNIFIENSAFSGEEETHPVIYTDSAALKEWETLPLKGKIRSEKGFLKIVLFTS